MSSFNTQRLRDEGFLPPGYIPAQEWRELNGLTVGQASGLFNTNQVKMVRIRNARFISTKSKIRHLPLEEQSYNKRYEVING